MLIACNCHPVHKVAQHNLWLLPKIQFLGVIAAVVYEL